MIEFVRREMREENLGFCPQPRVMAVLGCQMMLGSQLDPAQKRIQVSDTRGAEAKILDSCSSSQIHLWSKSQISNRSTERDSTTARLG
ncbi:hypothetical protein QUA54_02285 [Microcoleus sp. MOSTC5]|uniref:hypothetical protein n=1 Tax=Microcoleus sp. MOSTC5 TaxID=3055378 RepID=UPI002FD7218E